MKVKKVAALLMAAIMTMSVMTGCGSGGNDSQGGGSVSSYPAFLFADIEQDRINAFFRGRARIKVIRKYLMAVIQTVMNNNLFAFKVGMAERRRDINNCAWGKTFAFFSRDKALKVCHGKRKECGIAGTN